MAFNPNVHALQVQNLLDTDLETRSQLIRARLIFDYQKLKTVSEFIEQFAREKSHAEKTEIAKRLSKLQKLPKIEAIENGIMISSDAISLKIDMRYMNARRFLVNDQSFTVAPKLSWPLQTDILLDKLVNPRSKSTHGALLSLLIPQAHAVVINTVIWAALTMVSVGILNTAISHWGNDGLNALDWQFCDSLRRSTGGDMPRNPKICKEYRKELDALAKQTPANEAVKNALSDGSSKNEKYITGKEEICPFQVTDKHYHAKITIVPTSEASSNNQQSKTNNVTSEQGEATLVRIYAQVEGDKLKSASVYHDEYVEGESKSTLLANYLVDSESILEEIVIPKLRVDAASLKKEKTESPQKLPERSAKQNNDNLTIRIRATANLQDQPELQAQQAYFQGIFKHLGDRLKVCKIKSDEKEAAKIAPSTPAAKELNKAATAR